MGATKNEFREFDFLKELIAFRMHEYFQHFKEEEKPVADPPRIDPPKVNLPKQNTPKEASPELKPPELKLAEWTPLLREFIINNKLTGYEAIILLTALTPHIVPELFDRTIGEHLEKPGDFPALGGVRGQNCRFYLPTGETVLFLLAGNDIDRRLLVKQFFGAEHIFWEKKILWLEDMQETEPSMHGRLIMSPDYVDILTYGTHRSPQFSISFPAKKIAPDNTAATPLSFDHIVLPEELKDQIKELKNWLVYQGQLKERFGNLKSGYRALFFGPSGTGKTFTARILGDELGKEVYKIDLSMVVSKYIGETEKNLEQLFAKAQDKEWILFFDEADALFGKRTSVKDAHDKFANQEVSYLLQRIEDYPGMVILTSNMKNNIDDAFMRRFNSVLKFPFPDATAREQIWALFLPSEEKNLKRYRYRERPGGPEVNIPRVVKKYELSGGSIMNVVHYAAIKAIEQFEQQQNDNKRIVDECHPKPEFTVYLSDVLNGIRRELIKEGKPFT